MKHMKHIIALLGILVAGSIPAQAIVSPFIRGGVDFSRLNAVEFVRDSSVDWQDKLKGWDTGYFGEVGIKFFDSHTLAVEIGYLKAAAEVAAGTAGMAASAVAGSGPAGPGADFPAARHPPDPPEGAPWIHWPPGPR